MLPDFPSLKKSVAKGVNRYMRHRRKVHGHMFNEIPQRQIFEGDRTAVERPHEARDESKMVRLSAEMTVDIDELHAMSLEQVLRRYDEMVKDLVGQQIKHFFELMNTVTEKTGNVVDAKGQRLTPELFFEMLEKIQIDFNSDGSPNMPTILISPSQQDDVRAAQEQFESDPALRQRYENLMKSKFGEWGARQAIRTLAG